VAAGVSVLGSWRDPEVVSGLLTPRGSGESTIRVAQAWEPGALARGIETYDAGTGAWGEPGWLMPVAFRSRVGEEGEFAAWGNLRRALRGEAVHGGEQARGWPRLAFRATTVDGVAYRGGLVFADASARYGGRLAPVIPLIPMPLGLAADTALYGGVVGAAVEGFYVARRARRRRRSRCAGCGYALEGIGRGARCPECGRAA
jgi:hypothetical protein